jgi:hypothetical protein
MPLHQFPIVEASPLQGFIVQVESKRLDQMQRGSGGGAEARHVAGVRRDFRFD